MSGNFCRTLCIVAGLLCCANSAEAITAAQRTEYLNIKKVASQVGKNSIERGRGPSEPVYFDICDPLSVFLGAYGFSSKLNRRLLDIAGWALNWEGLLHAFPPELWKAKFEEQENVLVAQAFAGQESDLNKASHNVADAAEAMRKKRNLKKIGRISAGTECGGGGLVPITIKSRPKGANIDLISEFDYALCQVDGKDPNKQQTCPAWRRVPSGGRVEVGGYYYVKASWKNASLRPTRMSLGESGDVEVAPDK